MTHFLKDILRQSEELRRTIGLLSQDGGGRPALEAATAAIRGARHIYLTGIGSSWHAALNVSALSARNNSLPLFIIFVPSFVMPWGLNWLSTKWRRERRGQRPLCVM